MKISALLITSLLLGYASPVYAQAAPESASPAISYPASKRGNVVEEHFGEKVADPYRWLENDPHKDADVAAWIRDQNALTQSILKSIPGRDILRSRMTQLLDYERLALPIKRGDRYFFTLNKGMANQSSLYFRQGENGENRLLINPNTWAVDNADALAEWGASDDGRFVAYAVQTGGTDWRTIKVLEVDTGKVLADTIQWARYTRIAWSSDGSGFFYSRMPEPAAGATASAGVANHAVYFHKLGAPQSEDRLIYSTPDRPGLLHVADRVRDGRYVHISSTPGSNESELTVVDLETSDRAPRTVVANFDAEWAPIANDGTKLIAITSAGAERRRIVSLDLADKSVKPVEILAEAAGKSVISDATIANGKLLVAYLVDAKTEIHRFSLDGKPEGQIPLPGIGTAGGLSGEAGGDHAFFVYNSYDAPLTTYRYDVSANKVEPWVEPKTPIDLSKFVVDQRFYSSKDGTKVPMFIVRRKDVALPAPTILYGYGGFGVSMLPEYNSLRLAWVEQGGVFVVANIRGGGEYGRSWHRAAQMENRQNAFDDFIAAGEFLKAEKITTPHGLTIQGGSGGGPLVGAVTNQRPDLFDAALPAVGVMDMLRYDKFTGGALWTVEYGNPAEEKHFRNLLGYSPYHSIKDGVDYPAILATTADADDRVVPAHTFKYVAALQAAKIGPKPHLARIETRAGHGAGQPLDKSIEQYADMWAFAAHWTGLKIGEE